MIDYQQFKLDQRSLMAFVQVQCLREMYLRAQPSVELYDLLSENERLRKQGEKMIDFYEHYYLSNEEAKYIIDKYTKAYRWKSEWKEDVDLIIQDFITSKRPIGEDGEAGPLCAELSDDVSRKIINFLHEEREYYRFDRYIENFSFGIWNVSPNSCEEKVIKYWKSKGIDLVIDPRHYNADKFWCEENGYNDDEEE